jgi:dipeptidase
VKKICIVSLVTGAIAALLLARAALACTNILVTKGASADGSVMITYSADAPFHPILGHWPATDHEPGSLYEVRTLDGKLLGKIPQVPHTYNVIGLMNEHQVAIGETTFGGREELHHDPEGLLDYDNLMILALQRARTAREAIEVITSLVDEHGYASEGESISIGDKEEAWILEIIGPGEFGDGAQWVAVRVPDGYVSVHANMSRIGEFPLDDPENCLYSDNVISFAVERGYWDPSAGKPFSFRDAYDPESPVGVRVCAGRVWSVLRRVAPSRDFSPDYHRGVVGAERYPLWVRPDEKLTLQDVMALMRDHFEGTEFDMTKGLDAGPFASPYRWRDLTWEVDGVKYCWERPISSQQAGFVFVSQARSWLPDPVGGVYWYAGDDSYTACYVPLYCGITEAPRSYTVGTIGRFSWDSAWWVFNFVSNLAYMRWSRIYPDVAKVQRDIEGTFFALQPAVEKTAVELAKKDPDLMLRYLTDYSVSHAEQVVERWRELGEYLLTKHNDGYVRGEEGGSRGVGYPTEWLRRVIESDPERWRVPIWEEAGR